MIHHPATTTAAPLGRTQRSRVAFARLARPGAFWAIAAALGAQGVIAGHGTLEPPTALADLRQWLLALRQAVRLRRDQGMTLDEILPVVQATMETFDGRAARERLPMAIRQVYADLDREQA